ncbi:nucleotidyl transferase AbiEii/AbiGii toxin family protein [Flavitalea sp. BT771]|uniref:nucleotidyl transferase AbiEii/AbiGii toxin family protein n=1 Tax=Flavitalea sp. BT771 TaxID=3063329 RepID=UPI0034C5CC17
MIFTGGTALAKAHRILQRFSEDIDFRLVAPTRRPRSRPTYPRPGSLAAAGYGASRFQTPRDRNDRPG